MAPVTAGAFSLHWFIAMVWFVRPALMEDFNVVEVGPSAAVYRGS